MQVTVSMTTEKDEFVVGSWWARNPEIVVDTLRRQLEAAQAIWPKLGDYRIEKRPSKREKSHAERGVVGGNARAIALSPERRAEIAKNAAEKRWGSAEHG